jgi:hypothetical protein
MAVGSDGWFVIVENGENVRNYKSEEFPTFLFRRYCLYETQTQSAVEVI